MNLTTSTQLAKDLNRFWSIKGAVWYPDDFERARQAYLEKGSDGFTVHQEDNGSWYGEFNDVSTYGLSKSIGKVWSRRADDLPGLLAAMKCRVRIEVIRFQGLLPYWGGGVLEGGR